MDKNEEIYRNQFSSLEKYSNDENKYLEELMNLIIAIMQSRTTFVKNTGSELKRVEFYNLALSKIKSTYEEYKCNSNSKENISNIIEFIGCGHTSLAFRIGDKVLKIGKCEYDLNKNLDKVSNIPCVVPIYFKENIKADTKENYSIQITSLVDTTNITEEDLYQAYKNFREYGYIWNDPRLDNIGRIGSNIVIFDLEDFVYVGEEISEELLDEISMTSYNQKTYTYEERYRQEHQKSKVKKLELK